MRRILIGMAALGFAMVAWAKPGFTEPGWYQVADTIYGSIVWKGPFADEASCLQTLPPGDDEGDFGCQYLRERPDWDE